MLHEDDGDWNASDYAHHLSRRARGLPFWFSLATYGTDAYREAVETTLRVAHEGAELIRASEHCELVLEPELSVVVFRRTGWTAADYAAWSTQQLADGDRVRRAQRVERRDRAALLRGQPEHDGRRPGGDHRLVDDE